MTIRSSAAVHFLLVCRKSLLFFSPSVSLEFETDLVVCVIVFQIRDGDTDEGHSVKDNDIPMSSVDGGEQDFYILTLFY